jgi:hypothetical protein
LLHFDHQGIVAPMGLLPRIPCLGVIRLYQATTRQMGDAPAVSGALGPLHVTDWYVALHGIAEDVQLVTRELQLHAMGLCRPAVKVDGSERVL